MRRDWCFWRGLIAISSSFFFTVGFDECDQCTNHLLGVPPNLHKALAAANRN